MVYITYAKTKRKDGTALLFTVEFYENSDGRRPVEEFLLLR